jgi:RNA polymerase sigma-70 factor (ECF subfamily)
VRDVIQGIKMTFAFAQTTVAAFQPAPSAESSTDESLIERIARRDQLAMRALFARHRLRVYRFALRLVRDETLAEDVLSDVFLDVWRQAGRFEARAAVSTWLLAITRFKALSATRRRPDVELNDEMAATIPDPADDPELALQHASDARMLRGCLVKLSPAHAEIIDLVYYHDKSVKEVADIVGISDATVKTRMFYARNRLAQLVQDAAPATIH